MPAAESLCIPPYVFVLDRELEHLTYSHFKLDTLVDIDCYCDVLPPNELHSGLKYRKVQNTYKKSYPSRVQRYGKKNPCLWLALVSAHVSKLFTLWIFCYTYIHRNLIVQKNARRRNWYSLDTFWVCVVVVSWCGRIDMVEIEQNVMALRNQNFWRMKNSWRRGVDKAESLPHAEF